MNSLGRLGLGAPTSKTQDIGIYNWGPGRRGNMTSKKFASIDISKRL